MRPLLFGIANVSQGPMGFIEGQMRLPPDTRTLVLPEDPDLTLVEDFLVQVIKLNCGRGSWNHRGPAAIELTCGVLVVSQSRDTHVEIERFLKMLEQRR